jgi:acid phosphatase family membrane protein YuiD
MGLKVTKKKVFLGIIVGILIKFVLDVRKTLISIKDTLFSKKAVVFYTVVLGIYLTYTMCSFFDRDFIYSKLNGGSR